MDTASILYSTLSSLNRQELLSRIKESSYIKAR